MTNIPKSLYRGFTSTDGDVVYTVPVGTTTIVTNIVVGNPGDVDGWALLKLNGIDFMPGVAVRAHEMVALDVAQALETGEDILAKGSVEMAVHICGVEVT